MPLELVVLVSRQAGEASRALQELKKRGEPTARNAAVLIRDQDGQVFLFETGRVDHRHMTLLGAIAGLLVEPLASLDRKHVAGLTPHSGFPEEFLVALRADLPPGGSALVLLVELDGVAGMLDLLAEFKGQIWQQILPDQLVVQFATRITQEGR